MSSIVHRLALIPLTVVAGMLLLGAFLGDLHPLLPRDWLAPTDGSTGGETPQWIGRLTVMLYYLILPVAFLALWARRRTTLGRLGRVGAALIAPQVVAYLVLTVASVVHGLLLGRGDLPGWAQSLEIFVFVFYLGILVLGVAWIRDSSSNRLIGVLLITGLVVSFILPFLLTAAFAVLAWVVAVRGLDAKPEKQVTQAQPVAR